MTGPLTGPCREVRLADGSRVTLRAVEPEDKRLLAAAFDGLSEQSRYRRFFTPLRELDERQLTSDRSRRSRPRGAGDRPAQRQLLRRRPLRARGRRRG